MKLSGHIDSDIEYLSTRHMYLKDYPRIVNQLVFSLPMRSLYACSADYTIKVYSVPSLQKKYELKGHKGAVTGCVLSPDGCFLLSFATDSSLLLWNLASNSMISALKGNKQQVHNAMFSNCMKYMISSSKDYEIIIWNFNDCTINSVIVTNSQIQKLSISSDNQFLVGGLLNEDICVWNFSQNLMKNRTNFEIFYEITDLKIHPNNFHAFILYSNGTLIIWDFHDDIVLHRETPRLNPWTLKSYKMHISMDCKFFFRIHDNSQSLLEIFQIENGKSKKIFTFLSDSSAIKNAILSPNNQFCFLSFYDWHPISLIRISDKEIVSKARIHHESIQKIVKLENKFMVSESKYQIAFWDYDENKCLFIENKNYRLDSIQVTKNQKYAIAAFSNQTVFVYKLIEKFNITFEDLIKEDIIV